MTTSAGLDLRLLLAHSAWIQRLARRMVATGDDAEDLVQETWLAALERPRGEVRSVRAWLAGILANRARETRRSETRRQAREQRKALDATRSSEPSAAETFDAAATGRDLASLVLELEEPFRTAVLLRYYQDLSPRRIARRLGISVRTVNSRLARGLERLRERWKLRERAAGRAGDAWSRSLLALACPTSNAGVPAAASVTGAVLPLGVALMNAKIWMGSALLGVGALAWWLNVPRAGVAPATAPSAAPREAPEDGLLAAAREPGAFEPTPREGDRRSVAPPATPQPAPAAPASATRTIRGHVLDPDARPLSGVDIYDAWSDVEPRRTATSGAGGVFELELSSGGGDLRATDPALVTVMSGRVSERTEVEPLVVVAPRIELAGVVLDESREPLGEARITFERPHGFSTRFYAVFDATENHEWDTQTDERGRFELAPVPSIEGSSLVVELEGFETWRGEVPRAGDRDLVLTLVRSSADVPVVVGRVVDPEQRPVAGAWVSLGKRSTATDAAGEFRLERDDAPDALELCAMKSGHRLALLRAAEDASGRPAWPPYVVLVLGGPPLSLAGCVVDAAGKPRAGLRLWIGDPTRFGVMEDEMLASAEYYLAAGAGGDGSAYWSWKYTDADGRFRLGGLLERDYSVRVFNPRTLEIHDAGPFRAGEESLEIVFADGPLGSITGRAVTRDGRGLAGVQVRVLGNTVGGVWMDAASAISDAEGRFSFANLGGDAVVLAVSGEDLMPLWNPVRLVRGGETEVELSVAVRCTFKVDLGPAAKRADALGVLDGDGARMTLLQIGPSGSLSGESFPLVEGRSDSLGVDDQARTLVLLKDGVEVLRVPLDLRPGSLNLITP